MEIICDLYAQWISAVRQELTKAGVDHSAIKDQDCAIIWQAWKRRTVPAGSRQILKAKEFICPSHLQAGLTDLENAFQTGVDIWPWQSKLIDRPTVEDGLFNDYRVFHFHLGKGTGSSGYINRSGELLFAIVDASTVYEIGVYHHGDWYELDILDIIDENWPRLLDRVTLRGILDVTQCARTRDEVKAIRKANVISAFKLKSGRIIIPPGGGIATDGTSLEAVMAADGWANLLCEGEERIIADIKKQVQQGTMPDKNYSILLHATDDEVSGVFENSYKRILWKRESF